MNPSILTLMLPEGLLPLGPEEVVSSDLRPAHAILSKVVVVEGICAEPSGQLQADPLDSCGEALSLCSAQRGCFRHPGACAGLAGGAPKGGAAA